MKSVDAFLDDLHAKNEAARSRGSKREQECVLTMPHRDAPVRLDPTFVAALHRAGYRVMRARRYETKGENIAWVIKRSADAILTDKLFKRWDGLLRRLAD